MDNLNQIEKRIVEKQKIFNQISLKRQKRVETITKTLDKISGVEVLNIDLKSGKTEINCSNLAIKIIKDSIISLNYKIKK